MEAPVPFVRRLRIQNYKSIGKCDIQLQPISVLVGRNSAGKSNILDSLRFVADGLQTSLDHAMKSRGGIDAVRRQGAGSAFAIEVDLSLSSGAGTYGFEIEAREKGGFVVRRERLQLPTAFYDVVDGVVRDTSLKSLPPVARDRLFLVAAAGFPEFREAYDGLAAMGFYNLNPDEMKELQSPDAGELLRRDGGNIASVIARLQSDRPAAFERLGEYLRTIVPGISEVERVALGPKETLEFRQSANGSLHPSTFYAASVSDGTLRALGILTAVMQLVERTGPVTLVGIEEPETALHPAAAGALMDALKEAAEHTQVVLTSHSGVLLDQIEPSSHAVLVVVSREGVTEVAPIDAAGAKATREHLYSISDLQQMDQLQPDEDDLGRQQKMPFFSFETTPE